MPAALPSRSTAPSTGRTGKTSWPSLCDKFRSQSGYDCLLPGSGGKDSFYASHILKTRFGMHPLTVTWAPHVYTEWGWKNFQSWLHAGFDNYLMTPNGRVHRLLTRLAVDNLFHPFQAFMFGQKSLAPKMALLHDIPFVVYGENEAEYGNPIGDTTSAQRDWSYFTSANKAEIYLGGTSVQSLYDDFGLEEQDLLPYLPADPAQMQRKQVEVHYLGYYLKWHPQSCYYYAVEHGGFEASPERTPAPTASTTASMTVSTISITTPPSPSSASAAPLTTPRRKSARATSTAARAWHWCGAMTASSPSALQRKSSAT
jgi:N-acetyl sugar amidotransferase